LLGLPGRSGFAMRTPALDCSMASMASPVGPTVLPAASPPSRLRIATDLSTPRFGGECEPAIGLPRFGVSAFARSQASHRRGQRTRPRVQIDAFSDIQSHLMALTGLPQRASQQYHGGVNGLWPRIAACLRLGVRLGTIDGLPRPAGGHFVEGGPGANQEAFDPVSRDGARETGGFPYRRADPRAEV
jgi:hypothetical protein